MVVVVLAMLVSIMAGGVRNGVSGAAVEIELPAGGRVKRMAVLDKGDETHTMAPTVDMQTLSSERDESTAVFYLKLTSISFKSGGVTDGYSSSGFGLNTQTVGADSVTNAFTASSSSGPNISVELTSARCSSGPCTSWNYPDTGPGYLSVRVNVYTSAHPGWTVGFTFEHSFSAGVTNSLATNRVTQKIVNMNSCYGYQYKYSTVAKIFDGTLLTSPTVTPSISGTNPSVGSVSFTAAASIGPLAKATYQIFVLPYTDADC